MGPIIAFLLAVYLLSPIPLLIFLIASRHSIRRMEEDHARKEAYHQYTEEQYRRYVSQLQNQVRELDPHARLGVLQKPIPSPENAHVPSPVAEVLPKEAPAAPAVIQAQPIPEMPVRQELPEASFSESSKENSFSTLILVVGVVLLVLASIGFISATWSFLSAGVRAISLLSFSAIFLGAGVFAKAKLKLPNTSMSFYTIGSIALPVTIFGSAAFGLLGNTFTLDYPAFFSTSFLAFSSLMLLLFFGGIFFRSRVFAAGSLISLSLSILSVAGMIDFPFSLDVLFLTLFASGIIFLAPKTSSISETSSFLPYRKVYPVYAIVNMYVMTLVALCLSGSNRFSGIFLLLLAAAFLLSSTLRRKNGLLCLPALLLIMVGMAQIMDLSGGNLLVFSCWLVLQGVTLTALSYVSSMKKALSGIFLAAGIVFLIFSSFAAGSHMFRSDDWFFLALTFVPAAILTWLSYKKKWPLLFSGAIPPIFIFFFGIALHTVALIGFPGIGSSQEVKGAFPSLALTYSQYALIGLSISGILYILFELIPHHCFYTGTSSLILYHICVLFSTLFAFTLGKRPLPALAVITILLLSGTLFQANRRDFRNVRNTSLTTLPGSITSVRWYYAIVWPYFLILFFTVCSATSAISYSTTASFLLLFSLIFFLYPVLLYLRARTKDPSRTSTPQWISIVVSSGVLIFLSIASIFYSADTHSHRVICILNHLTPLLIPILFFAFLIFDRLGEKHFPGDGKGTFAPTRSLIYSLAGLSSFSLFLPAVLDIFPVLGLDSIYLRTSFIHTILALLCVLYFLGKRYISKSKMDILKDNNDVPFRFSLLLWTSVVSSILILSFLFFNPDSYYPVVPILLMLIVTGSILLTKDHHTAFGTIFSVTGTVLYILFFDHYMGYPGNCPVLLYVFLLQLPVFLYCALLFRSSEKEKPVTKERFFWGALLSQIFIFLSVPHLTRIPNRKIVQEAIQVGDGAHSTGRLDNLFRFSFSITTSTVLFLALLGFIVLELVYIFRIEKKTSRRRGTGLIFFTLSWISWMPILSLPSLAAFFEAAYLLPGTVFLLFMNWICKRSEYDNGPSSVPTVRFVLTCIQMWLLSAITIAVNDSFSLILFGIISFLILILGYARRKKNYLILGVVCVLGMVAFIANRLWGSMAWWFYLFITGTILVSIAVRNEIKKRK